MTEEFPKYEANFSAILEQINDQFNYDVTSFFNNLEFSSFLSGLASSISGIISTASMIIIYVLFFIIRGIQF